MNNLIISTGSTGDSTGLESRFPHPEEVAPFTVNLFKLVAAVEERFLRHSRLNWILTLMSRKGESVAANVTVEYIEEHQVSMTASLFMRNRGFVSCVEAEASADIALHFDDDCIEREADHIVSQLNKALGKL